MSEGSDLNWPVNKAGLAAGETLYSYDSEITARVQDLEVLAKRPKLTPNLASRAWTSPNSAELRVVSHGYEIIPLNSYETPKLCSKLAGSSSKRRGR